MHPRSLTLLRYSYFAWHQLEGDHADGKYEIPYVIGWYVVVWSTAILTYLPVLLFPFLLAHVRFDACDFYCADVGL